MMLKELMLNERYDGSVIDEHNKGLARELARMNLTLNTYTQWYWKTDLLNLLNFLSLRADSHAQYEIRAYADVMINTLKNGYLLHLIHLWITELEVWNYQPRENP